jgi:ketosteroid isomerase-like protein
MNSKFSLVVWLGIVIAVLGLLYYTPATQKTDSAATDAVLRSDQARLAAMMKGDGAALARVMSEALVFVHSDGRTQGKADYIKNLMAGDTAYADAKTSDVKALQPAPDVVILIGAQSMRKKLGPTWTEIQLNFLSVWRNENGTWRMFAWQSMKPSGSSVVPGK